MFADPIVLSIGIGGFGRLGGCLGRLVEFSQPASLVKRFVVFVVRSSSHRKPVVRRVWLRSFGIPFGVRSVVRSVSCLSQHRG